MSSAALAFATCLGVGYAPVAPGTFGSMVGLLIWALLPRTPQVQGAVILLLLAAGIWSASTAERHFRSTDPSAVVIDEVMGMLVTLFMLPVEWVGASAGFLIFRLFDVVKLYPANRLERLHGGVGVMADDLMSGVYANLALRVLLAAGGSWITR
jgi:phosphatidylglycerophosphatase A